jgi:hypothetical protein
MKTSGNGTSGVKKPDDAIAVAINLTINFRDCPNGLTRVGTATEYPMAIGDICAVERAVRAAIQVCGSRILGIR